MSASPTLWTHIRLDVNEAFRRVTLERSARLPLHVYVKEPSSFLAWSPMLGSDVMQRAVRLHFCVPWRPSLLYMPLRLLGEDTPVPSSVPRLRAVQRLELFMPDPRRASSVGRDDYSDLELPRLIFSLMGICDTLHELYVDSSQRLDGIDQHVMEDLAIVIGCLSALTCLEFVGLNACLHEAVRMHVIPRRVLPHLRVLRFVRCNPEWHYFFCRALECPALRERYVGNISSHSRRYVRVRT